jgi:signal transduction histidine kinase
MPCAPAVVTNRMFAVELVGNLLDNAIKHNLRGGSVRVAIERDGARLQVVVEDDGPGIAPEERAGLFARFARGHRDPARGTGLGLSIVDALARAIGAEIALETPRSGRGLRAVVTFDIAPPDRIAAPVTAS